MDTTERKITKIAREAGKFTVQMMKEDGIGTAEFDVIHLIRHNPGITQKQVRDTLKRDKGATAKRVASLEHKGYLVRKPNPEDKRSQLLFATEKAEHLKNSKAQIETTFYEWLLADLKEEEKESFCRTLDKLYWKSKMERRVGFENLARMMNERMSENEPVDDKGLVIESEPVDDNELIAENEAVNEEESDCEGGKDER